MKTLSRRALFPAVAVGLLWLLGDFAPNVASLTQAASQDGRGPKTVYIVRHGEKRGPAVDNLDGTIFGKKPECKPHKYKDKLLTKMGVRRAHDLAHTLRNKDIQHIYVTKYRRTQQTAQFLAKDADISRMILCFEFDEEDDFVERVSKKIFKLQVGNVLVVTHSTAIIPLVDALGKKTFADINDCYNYVFVITGVTDKAGEAAQYTYGDSKPGCTAGTPLP